MVAKGCSLQIQLKSLAEEMQAITKGLEKVKQELSASANDGPVSEVFHKVYSVILGIGYPCFIKKCIEDDDVSNS